MLQMRYENELPSMGYPIEITGFCTRGSYKGTR
jgi:hypothetical protein